MTIKAVLSYRAKQDGTYPIRIYVYANGRKRYIQTGLSILTKDWNKRKEAVKKTHPFSQQYNERITSKKREIEQSLLRGNQLNNLHGQTPDADFLAYMKQYIKNENLLAPSTIRIYKTTYKHLSNYLVSLSKKELFFNEITPIFTKAFRDYLYEIGCLESGQQHAIKKIKKLMRLSKEQGLHQETAWKEIKVPKARATNKIYLTESEMQKLYALDLSYQPTLEKERDRFWLAYKFIMRFSDIIRVRKEMVVEREGNYFLVYVSSKTKIKATVPLSKSTMQRLEKHQWNLNFTSNQQANRELKRIASMAGINQVVEQDGKTAPKSQFVTFHTARRSGATNAYLSGLSLKIIADIGGWKKLATLQIYLRANQLISANQAASHRFFSD